MRPRELGGGRIIGASGNWSSGLLFNTSLLLWLSLKRRPEDHFASLAVFWSHLAKGFLRERGRIGSSYMCRSLFRQQASQAAPASLVADHQSVAAARTGRPAAAQPARGFAAPAPSRLATDLEVKSNRASHGRCRLPDGVPAAHLPTSRCRLPEGCTAPQWLHLPLCRLRAATHLCHKSGRSAGPAVVVQYSVPPLVTGRSR
jgi:hypothetical protein